jgi:hypothetical protein
VVEWLWQKGTAENPIVFTSVLSEEVDLDETDMGLWGGVVVLGYAPISADAVPANIEGVPVNDGFGLYGGNESTRQLRCIELCINQTRRNFIG